MTILRTNWTPACAGVTSRRHGQAACERLEREINVTDEQIDQLVYGLCGLTKEEIKIVEGRA